MTIRADLEAIASNYQWTWRRQARDLLMSLPGASERAHPVGTVAALTPDDLTRLEGDAGFRARLADEAAFLRRGMMENAPSIAYCSPEYGLTNVLPMYAGGLGILSGDHLKAASDSGVTLAGIGLLYRGGTYRQRIVDGGQVEYFPAIDPVSVGATDTGLQVSVPLPGRTVHARVWRIDVGRVPLILLDTDVDENHAGDRTIAHTLYEDGAEHRIDQEMVLGIGGGRALAALGWDIEVHHLNEGHAGFLTLDLIDRVIRDGDIAGAVEKVRPGVVFTTHTSVPAGIDRFAPELLLPYLEYWAGRWGVDADQLWQLGQDPDDSGLFNMAVFCLRMSGAANGVSALHGEVSRNLFAGVEGGSPIGHVTNGVHARSWTGEAASALFDEALGPGWSEGDPAAWDLAHTISDSQIESVLERDARRLAELVDVGDGALDPRALIIGFARRFAPYKRANLLLHDLDRLTAMLDDDERPVHFVFAGTAHPENQAGKALIAEIVRFAGSDRARGRFTFIPDYDMLVGSRLVAGSHLWLNNPVRGREASGTSGQKAVLNGGLNCSILDGWWAEMYDGRNGWAIPHSDLASPEERDAEEARAVIDTLLTARDEYYDARPAFYDRIRHAWATLGPRVTAARMIGDYVSDWYEPARRGDRSTSMGE